MAWKALASVVEILARVDPAKIDGETMKFLSATTVAPLLRDLEPTLADTLAWKLWSSQGKGVGATFRRLVPLPTRLWLAKAFAPSHPEEAAVVFEEGLQSQDAAIRTMAGMMVRSGIGGSMGFDKSAARMMETFREKNWNFAIPMWEALPLPLDRPLIQRTSGGRRDLVWLDRDATVAKTVNDVWPLIREQVADGLYFSQIGNSRDRGLSDVEGRIFSRFRNLISEPVMASHGGICGIEGKFGLAIELQADGSSLWECPIREEFRVWAPVSLGRVVLMSGSSLECRDRRGDVIWKTSLKGLNDPRFLVAIDDSRFVVSCGKSIGWLTKDGEYRPILKGLISAGWIRYHPTEPWIILEGSNMTVIVFDPKAGKETGRFDLDDGHGVGVSRFPFPRTYFPE